MEDNIDAEFLRLQNGEIAHSATTDLLYFQLTTLVENQPQTIETWMEYSSDMGCIQITRNYSAENPAEIVQVLEVYGQNLEGGELPKVATVTMPTSQKLFYEAATDELSAYLTIDNIIEALKSESKLNQDDLDLFEDLKDLAWDKNSNKNRAISPQLINDIGYGMAVALNNHAGSNTICSEFNQDNELESLNVQSQYNADVALLDGSLITSNGNFEVMLTEKETGNKTYLSFEKNGEVFINKIIEGEEPELLRLASANEVYDAVKYFTGILLPILESKDALWVSNYSAILGASIHHEGPDNQYGILMANELSEIRNLFEQKFEAENHFLANYSNKNKLSPLDNNLAENFSLPNVFSFMAKKLISLANGIDVGTLNPDQLRKGIYLKSYFFTPGTILPGVDINFGAYLNLAASIYEKDKPERMVIGLVPVEDMEIVRVHSSFN